MIDMFALLVTCGMISIVVFFAIRLNREREWFEPAGKRPDTRAVPGRPGTRKPVHRPIRR
jgi:hypothetical protein